MAKTTKCFGLEGMRHAVFEAPEYLSSLIEFSVPSTSRGNNTIIFTLQYSIHKVYAQSKIVLVCYPGPGPSSGTAFLTLQSQNPGEEN